MPPPPPKKKKILLPHSSFSNTLSWWNFCCMAVMGGQTRLKQLDSQMFIIVDSQGIESVQVERLIYPELTYSALHLLERHLLCIIEMFCPEHWRTVVIFHEQCKSELSSTFHTVCWHVRYCRFLDDVPEINSEGMKTVKDRLQVNMCKMIMQLPVVAFILNNFFIWYLFNHCHMNYFSSPNNVLSSPNGVIHKACKGEMISMAQSWPVVIALQTQWSYHSLTLSHRHLVQPNNCWKDLI